MAKANKLIPVVDGTAGTPIELTDSRIEITNPAANDLLQYDSTQQQFVNTPASSVVPSHRTVNHEQITDSSLGDINLHDGFYFPNAVQDYDGNWYGAVVIGDQVWLGENLRTTHYADGTAITNGGSSTSDTTAYYYNHISSNIPFNKRGYMYNWPAVMNGTAASVTNPSGVQGIAPNGWHIPSLAEYEALYNYVNKQSRYKYSGNSKQIAKSLASTLYWNTNATAGNVGNDQSTNNATGFNVVPAGRRTTAINLYNTYSFFWTTSGHSNGGAYINYYASDKNSITWSVYEKSYALSVRCVSDLTPVQFRDWYVNQYGTLQHNVLSSELSAGKDIEIIPQSQYVPEGFEELEYISSTGTQWLNTYVVLGYNNTVSIKIVAQGTGDRGLICGFDQDWSGAYLGDNGSKYYMIGLWHTDERNTSNSLLKTTLSSTWTSTSSQYTQSGSIDDVSNTVYTSSRLNNINLEFLLFRSNAWETADSYWAGRIFECKIWKNGKLVRNFVPARRISDNVVGLYETVNKEFYSNKGTGVFNAGPTVAIGAKTIISYTGIEIPNLTNNSGKVLAVNGTETDVEWVETQECMWYGVRKDRSNDSTTLERIGNLEMHKTLPIQSKMRRCLLLDNGTVNYYLSDTDSTKKEDGVTAAVLDGTDGQVMVEIPEHYVMYDTYTDEVTGHVINEWKISECPLPGFTKVNKCYYSAYEAALDRTNNKLSSVVNTTAQYRGGNNTSSWDGTYRSLLGMPVTNTTANAFRTLARNRGSRWSLHYNALYTTVCTLYLVEYANTNIQLDYNSSLTSDGYHQGGLGNGVTTVPAGNNSWSNYNNFNPMCPCGITNSLGNNSGTVSYTIESATQGEPFANVNVPSYRGIENLYGHIWKFMDGVIVQVQSNDAGGESKVYICDDISKFTDVPTSDYEYIGNTLRASQARVKNIMFPCMIPQESGATSTTGWADAFSGGAVTAVQNRVPRVGGMSIQSSDAGIACIDIDYWFTYGHAIAGSRLCYTPMTVELPPLEGNSGKVLAVNSGENGVEWVTQSGGGGGGASQLNDLSDVTISSAASGQTLLHNGTNWVNGALPQEVLVCSYDTSNNTMDKTPAEIVAAKAANKIVICKLSYPTTDFLFLNQANSDPFVVFTGFSQTTSSTSILTAKYHVLRYTTTDSWKFFTFNIQQQLVSGTNIKTINGNSLLGSGDLTISGSTEEVLVCTFTGSNPISCDKTVAQMYDAYQNKKIVIGFFGAEDYILYYATSNGWAVFFALRSYDGITIDKLITSNGGTTWTNSSVTVQEKLVSGTNIKTINGNSLLGSGDLTIGGVTIYSGSTAPSSSTGSNGDIYIQTVS